VPIYVVIPSLSFAMFAGKTWGEAVRRVEGFRLAQVLVACSNLRVHGPADLQVRWVFVAA